MEQPILSLASEFNLPQFKDWQKLVQTQIKNPAAYQNLVSRTFDGIDILPLYDHLINHSATPGKFPYTRSCSKNTRKWKVAQVYRHPDPGMANQFIQEDLNTGVSHVRLQMSEVSCRAESISEDAFLNDAGIECYQLTQLDALLSKIQIDRVPLELRTGASFLEFSALLFTLAKQRQISTDEFRFSINADPAGTFAEFGALPTSIENILDRLTLLANYCSTEYPKCKAVGVSGAVYHNAGASQAQEIGTMLATGITYLRTMTNAGMDIDQVCSQMSFTLTADTEFFQNIAKFRVLRELWAQICRQSGAKEENCKIDLHGETSYRMLSQRDPWVNLLRNTIATCSSAIGGAKTICCHTFDSALGSFSTLGHRMSRNTQLLLQDETGIHNTIDPTGGSFFVENYCKQLRKKSWDFMQNIESEGGIFSALQSGNIQRLIMDVKQRRAYKIHTKQQALTGVSEFANLEEPALESAPVDLEKVRRTALDEIQPTLFPDDLSTSIPDLIEAYESGLSTQSVSTRLNDDKVYCSPLTPERLSAPFESLRDASDLYCSNHGMLPEILVLTLGSPTQFNTRLGFLKNFFAAGGISVKTIAHCRALKEVPDNVDTKPLRLLVLCSDDANYNISGQEVIGTIRESGIEKLYIAGNALTTLVDTQLTLDCNSIEILQLTHKLLGVQE